MDHIFSRISQLRNFSSSSSGSYTPDKKVLFPDIFQDKITSVNIYANCNKFYSKSGFNCHVKSNSDSNSCYQGIIYFGENVKLSAVYCEECIKVCLEKRKISKKTDEMYWKSYPIWYDYQEELDKIILKINIKILKLLVRLCIDIDTYNVNMLGILFNNLVISTKANELNVYQKYIIDCNHIHDYNDINSLSNTACVKLSGMNIEFQLIK